MIYTQDQMRESQYKKSNLINPFIFYNEAWIQISSILEDIDDRYWISNYGRVFDTNIGCCMVPFFQGNGYLAISLQRKKGYYASHNQHSRIITIHRFVGFAFLGIPNNPSLTINHKDSIKINNYYMNLEWVTQKENVSYSFENGNRGVGENSNRVVYTEVEVRKICELLQSGIYDNKTICNIVFNSDVKDIYRRLIYDIRNRKFWNSISKDYTFAPSDTHNKFTEDQVRSICRYLEMHPEILIPNYKGFSKDVAINALGINPDNLSSKDRLKLFGWIKNIKYHISYTDIASEYNF